MAAQGNLIQIGPRFWSYNTALVDILPNPDGTTTTLGNVTKYSKTTSKHQSTSGANVYACDILLDKVPQGTHDLAAWYLSLTPDQRAYHTVTLAEVRKRRPGVTL